MWYSTCQILSISPLVSPISSPVSPSPPHHVSWWNLVSCSPFMNGSLSFYQVAAKYAYSWMIPDEGQGIAARQKTSPWARPKETLGKRHKQGENNQIKITGFRLIFLALSSLLSSFSAEVLGGRITPWLSWRLQNLPVSLTNNIW